MQSRRKNLENINYCVTARFSSTADCSWKQLFGDIDLYKTQKKRQRRVEFSFTGKVGRYFEK